MLLEGSRVLTLLVCVPEGVKYCPIKDRYHVKLVDDKGVSHSSGLYSSARACALKYDQVGCHRGHDHSISMISKVA
jgi:hypothetical protein